MEWRFFDDPAEFLDVAGAHLAEQPVVSTVIASIAERIGAQRAAGIPWPEGVPCWFAVVMDSRTVRSAVMRTAPFGDHPAYLLPMPADAAQLLARTLLDRDEVVLAANGALPAAEVFCAAMAAATGRTTEVAQHTRLFELRSVVPPAPVDGRLRPARADEIDTLAAWYDAFMVDADEQAGREPGLSAHEAPDRDELLRRIATGRSFLWENESGRPVSLASATTPAFGVSRIGPVYTPKEERRRGYASAAVAAVSSLLLDHGERPCLFTDQANPTSNKIYEAIGYERVVDMANLLVV